MRIIAIIGNIVLLGTMILAWIGGPPGGQWWFGLLVIAVLVVNIIVLCGLKIKTTSTWLELYFKRKALEEKKKIEALEKEGVDSRK